MITSQSDLCIFISRVLNHVEMHKSKSQNATLIRHSENKYVRNLSCFETRFRLLCRCIYCTAALTSLSDSVSYIIFLFLFSEWRIHWEASLKRDFHSPFSLVASEIFRMGRVVKRIEQDEKILSLCSHLKFKYFKFCEIFSQRNQSDLFLESRGHFTRIKKFSQNGRSTALSGLKEDRPKVYSQNKN